MTTAASAVAYLRRAAAANPSDANAHWNLGLALADLHTAAGDQEPKAELIKGLDLNPSLIKTLGKN